MPFTAPRYSDGPGFLPGWLGGTLGVTPDAPAAPTADDIAAADAALLQRINRPGWTIASHSPIMDKDGKDTGNVQLTLAGPNGQPDSVVVDKTGGIVAGGEAKNTPTAPPAGTTARVDSPAQTATAAAATSNAANGAQNATTTAANDAAARATGAQNANTTAAAQAETARHNQASESDAIRLQDLNAANSKASNDLAQARLAWDQKSKQLDQDLAANKLTFDQWQSQWQAAHAQAQDANATAQTAHDNFVAEQNAQYQKAQIADAQTKNTETARSNQATEAQNKANADQAAQRDAQASVDRQRDTGSRLLADRAAQSTSMLNNWTNAAAGNKNFGLGGPIPQNMAAGMMSDANTQATNEMGGQSVMDQAAAMVHQANPALTGTQQGSAMTAVAAQMLQKQTEAKAQSAPAPQQPFAQSDINEGTNRQAPAPPARALDPANIGTAVGAAIAHIGGFTAPFAQSGVGIQ